MGLTTKQRMAWDMYRRRGMRQSQIAQVLGIRRESVNRLVARAEQRRAQVMEACSIAGDCRLLDALLAEDVHAAHAN